MTSGKDTFKAPKPYDRPTWIATNHPCAAPIDYEGFRAFGNEVSAAMEQAAVDNAAFMRRRSTTSLDVAMGSKSAVTSSYGGIDVSAPADDATAATGSKRVAPSLHVKDTMNTPAAKRPRIKKRLASIHGGQPTHNGIHVTLSPDLVDIPNRDDPKIMSQYNVMTINRSDAQKTYIRRGDKNNNVLQNEPSAEAQDRAPKNDNLECTFYHKLEQQEASQSIEWRRKLGYWLASILGKDVTNENWIIAELPKGYTMWEHIRGVWVLAGQPDKPIDPRKLILKGNEVVKQNDAAPAPAARDHVDNEFMVVDSPESDDDRKIKAKIKTDVKNEDSPKNSQARTPALDALATPSPAVNDNADRIVPGALAPAANSADTAKKATRISGNNLVRISTGQNASDNLPRDQQPMFKKTRDDLYIFGYENNRRYASPAEFFPHLLWLATAPISPDGKAAFPCTCEYCDSELDKERKANKLDRIDLAYAKWKEATAKWKAVR